MKATFSPLSLLLLSGLVILTPLVYAGSENPCLTAHSNHSAFELQVQREWDERRDIFSQGIPGTKESTDMLQARRQAKKEYDKQQREKVAQQNALEKQKKYEKDMQEKKEMEEKTKWVNCSKDDVDLGLQKQVDRLIKAIFNEEDLGKLSPYKNSKIKGLMHGRINLQNRLFYTYDKSTGLTIYQCGQHDWKY
jgi:hypothetical protein